MARIRTVKPEFWTSEQVVECSPNARLLFIGTWCFSDDAGIHPASTKRVKMEVFPADPFTDADVQVWIDELHRVGLLETYDVEGALYWRITGWSRHQKIDRPTFKFPPRSAGKIVECSPSPRLHIADSSPSPRDGMEGNGMEGKLTAMGDDAIASPATSLSAGDHCPHQQIIDAYHRILPMGRRVRVWNDARQAKLRSRWREDAGRQSVAWWEKLFGYIAESAFLTGRVHSVGRAPFEIDLEWIATPKNFASLIEGKYHREAA
jgi:hypothetical protein